MAGTHTEKAFEATIETHLVDKGGWHKLPASSYDRQLRLVPEDLLAFVQETQPDQWETLTRRHGEGRVAEEFLKRVASQIDKHGTLHVLRHGIKDQGIKFRLAYFKPAHSLTPDLIAKYKANRLAVLRQVPYSPQHHNTLDLLLTVNGLPVATSELKNNLTDQGVEEAVTQYRDDRDPHDPLLSRRALIHFAVDPYDVRMTTKLAGEDTRFLPFNRGRDNGGGNPTNPDGYDTSYLWETIWQRDTWLDVLARFLHIERPDDEEATRDTFDPQTDTIIFPRYHQWEAVQQLEQHVLADGVGNNYLVEHFAGAGKTKTIAWLVHRLAHLHDTDDNKLYDKVIVITDRVVLDDNLQEAIWQIDHQHGVVVNITRSGHSESKSKQLTAALASETAKIIVTTQQTFPHVLEEARDLPDRRYALVIDEAHSGQTGETAAETRAILSGQAGEQDDDEDETFQDKVVAAVEQSMKARGPAANISMFAFTATPKPKTIEMFGTPTGERGERGQALKRSTHLYSMKQAVDEGFILDPLATYVTYRTYYEIEHSGSGRDDDPEVDARKAAAKIARWVSLHPTNVAQKAQIVVEHYRRHTRTAIAGALAKAMLVTNSRIAAIRYKNAIDAYIAKKGYTDVKALVAFSGEETDPDLPEGENRFTEASMNGFPASQTKKKFDTDEYQILIVAEKYQTGFDQPRLHTMFVDKVLTGTNAVQTICRVNRTYPGKTDTFVLDFVNDAEQIREAFAPYYEGQVGEATDPNKLTDASDALDSYGVLDDDEMDKFVYAYLNLDLDDAKVHQKLYAHLSGGKDRYSKLSEDDQEAFRAQLKRFVNMYSFLSQILDYGDTDLEKRYLYGRYLAKVLPRAQDSGFNVPADLKLSALATRQQGEARNMSLEDGGGITTAFEGSGTGSAYQPTLAPLSQVINTLNERFGTEFTEADRLKIESIGQHMAQDEELQNQAAANPIDAFKYAFDNKFIKAIVERMGADEELSTRLLDDEKFRQVVASALLPYVFNQSRAAAQQA